MTFHGAALPGRHLGLPPTCSEARSTEPHLPWRVSMDPHPPPEERVEAFRLGLPASSRTASHVPLRTLQRPDPLQRDGTRGCAQKETFPRLRIPAPQASTRLWRGSTELARLRRGSSRLPETGTARCFQPPSWTSVWPPHPLRMRSEAPVAGSSRGQRASLRGASRSPAVQQDSFAAKVSVFTRRVLQSGVSHNSSSSHA